MRFARLALLPLAALGLLGPARTAVAEDPPAKPAPPVPATPAPTPPAAACRPLTDVEKKELVAAFRNYLDVESEKAAFHRLTLQASLARLRGEGCDPLGDVASISKILYAARPFEAPLDKKAAGREKEVDVHVDPVTGITSVSSEAMRVGFSLPTRHPKDAKSANAMAPFPMIVTLHDLEDFQLKEVKKYPGAEVIRRRFPKATNKALLDEVIVFAPVATRAKFSNDGAIDGPKVALETMWRRYHVDFDRIVIDGGSDALLFAAAHGVYYAGVIVRGDAADVSPEIVRNFSHLKVYVVGTDASAAKKSLLAGGMAKENVTVGADGGLLAWIRSLERQPPKKIDWIVKDKSAQRFAYWVNINEIDPAVPAPTMKVEVLDTADDPNTVKVTSVGVRGISIFLNDRVVSLEKPVRVVINGKPLVDARLMTGRPGGKPVKLPAKLERSFDVMLDADRDLSVRRSRYYGFLYPVILDQIEVKNDATPEGEEGAKPAVAPGAATPEQETQAAQYFAKAEEREKEGDLVKAKSLLQRAIDVGETSVKPKAVAKLKEIEQKGDAGTEK